MAQVPKPQLSAILGLPTCIRQLLLPSVCSAETRGKLQKRTKKLPQGPRSIRVLIIVYFGPCMMISIVYIYACPAGLAKTWSCNQGASYWQEMRVVGTVPFLARAGTYQSNSTNPQWCIYQYTTQVTTKNPHSSHISLNSLQARINYIQLVKPLNRRSDMKFQPVRPRATKFKPGPHLIEHRSELEKLNFLHFKCTQYGHREASIQAFDRPSSSLYEIGSSKPVHVVGIITILRLRKV